ncbi:MAG: 4-hydroxyphenylpyruvate dioxygenase [Chloroflexi bacterium]|uniref:4-hydroxyphenylpyruvate dioxygenase n=1 Tax=Candidatus Chlorohelix allophototropha TaxID=3003348 RepID=A0A8T7M7M6_9CHLR|nr:4-hydroxyphenylpyruvate dioxygenase [Chloroflexota bacterium]WJW69930.1 4-hydroxyphenylpyruvate dioxygenase [Chloroflexota bacterium L227-S17]
MGKLLRTDNSSALSARNDEFFPIQSIDYVEFYVGNAKQAAYYYQTAFGFTPVAFCGLETGVRDCTSYVLRQGNITFVLTSALAPDSPIAEHVRLHGDGVKDICFRVPDVDYAYHIVTKHGAKATAAPVTLEDEFGSVRKVSIEVYGDTTHTFLTRTDYIGAFMPGFHSLPHAPESLKPTHGTGLAALDHIVANVDWNQMDKTVEFYSEVLGFHQLVHYDDKDISTEYSALMSKVMTNNSGLIKLPINEPARGLKKSQIEEYLDYYHGPGVQHLALITGNILNTVSELRKRGVEFITVPESYYAELEERVGNIKEPLEEVKRLGLLVDRDDSGYLLQIFTRPLQDRPTFFIEIIQRHHARSFGKGNFKALFEAIERDQALRGNL